MKTIDILKTVVYKKYINITRSISIRFYKELDNEANNFYVNILYPWNSCIISQKNIQIHKSY